MADIGTEVKLLKDTVTTLETRICDLKMANNELCSKIDVLTSENTILKSKLGSSRTPPNIDTSKPCLMMGSSMIRIWSP